MTVSALVYTDTMTDTMITLNLKAAQQLLVGMVDAIPVHLPTCHTVDDRHLPAHTQVNVCTPFPHTPITHIYRPLLLSHL